MTINFTNKTIELTTAEMKKASVYNSDAYKALKGAGITYKGFAETTGLSVDTVYAYTRGATIGMTEEAANYIISVAKKCFPSTILCRKQERTFNVTILVLKPTPQDALCLLREVNRSVFSTFGYFGAQKDLPLRKIQIFNHKDRTFTNPHTCIYHKNDHSVISVLRKVRAIKLTNKPFEIFIRNVLFCVSVRLELSDLFHGIFLQNVI